MIKAYGLILTMFLGLGMQQLQPVSPSPLSTLAQLQDDLQYVPCKKNERLNAARVLFEKMGATAAEVSVQKRKGTENLVVTLPGSGSENIVIGAHYDFIDKGCGAIDNWTGVVTLAHVYKSVHLLTRTRTVTFIAFDREEAGLYGSAAFVDGIAKAELGKYCAMVNIDSFGLAGPFALKSSSSDLLVDLSERVAARLQIPFYNVVIPNADADSSSFMKHGIPAVTLSGLSNEWESILHTNRDQSSLIHPESVYWGYRLTLLMWAQIEATPCAAYRDAKQPSLRQAK